MIDEEDLKRKVDSLLQLVFLELDVFHLCCHMSWYSLTLDALIIGNINIDDIPMGEYCRYVTMMISYIHDYVCH